MFGWLTFWRDFGHIGSMRLIGLGGNGGVKILVGLAGFIFKRHWSVWSWWTHRGSRTYGFAGLDRLSRRVRLVRGSWLIGPFRLVAGIVGPMWLIDSHLSSLKNHVTAPLCCWGIKIFNDSPIPAKINSTLRILSHTANHRFYFLLEP